MPRLGSRGPPPISVLQTLGPYHPSRLWIGFNIALDRYGVLLRVPNKSLLAVLTEGTRKTSWFAVRATLHPSTSTLGCDDGALGTRSAREYEVLVTG